MSAPNESPDPASSDKESPGVASCSGDPSSEDPFGGFSLSGVSDSDDRKEEVEQKQPGGRSSFWRFKLAGIAVFLVGLVAVMGWSVWFHYLYADRPAGMARPPELAIPVAGVESLGIVSPWGASRDGGTRTHKGIDIFAPLGTPVLAPRPGRVAGRHESEMAGKYLWLIDENGTHAYLFLHLQRFAANLPPGTRVQTGDTLGYVGKTGNATHTTAHLHFSVARLSERGTLAGGRRKINPYPFLRRNDTKGLARTLEAMRTGFARFTYWTFGKEWWLPIG